MCVPDLHPEDLLERDLGGVLSPTERAHLDAHLERCAACRFERLTRGDFAALRADETPTQPTVPLAVRGRPPPATMGTGNVRLTVRNGDFVTERAGGGHSNG